MIYVIYSWVNIPYISYNVLDKTTYVEYKEVALQCIDSGPFLLTWFNLNLSMDK